MSAEASRTETHMPKGAGNAYVFSVCNSISVSIIFGSPVLLYLQSLQASATVLSLAAGMVHFMNVLQIPGAYFLERVGYRRFMIRGWAARSIFIFFCMWIPLLPEGIDSGTRIVLVLVCLVCFNILRGISACAFLPWMTALIPAAIRGRYLANDQMAVQGASLISLGVCSWIMASVGGNLGFALLFGISFFSALLALRFLAEIPDVPHDGTPGRSSTAVPWLALLRYRPFLKLLVFDVWVLAGLAASGVFYVPMLKTKFSWEDGQILQLTVMMSLAALVTLRVSSRLADRTGSRPVLALALFLFGWHFVGWGLVAGGIWAPEGVVIWLIQGSAGVAWPLLFTANTRLTMVIAPEMGRSHFFAISQVVNSLAMGVAPFVFGLGIDVLGGWEAHWGPWTFHAFSLLYLVLCMMMVVGFLLTWWLDEERAMSTEEFFRELFVRSPVRAIGRLIYRRPFW